jgi:hypothetical protein
MARTFGGLILYQASGITPPSGNVAASAGNYQLVRNALGDWSWNNTAGANTVVFTPDNSDLARPFFNFPAQPGQGTVPLSNEFQEVFGTAAGAAGNPFSGIAPGSVTVGGGVPGTPNIPWGIALVDVFAVYSVQTAALVAATLAVNRNVFVENTATVNTAVLAPTAIALTTTTSATTPHMQKVTLAQPLVFETADFSTLIFELSIQAAATSAIRVYGMGAHYAVEYA